MSADFQRLKQTITALGSKVEQWLKAELQNHAIPGKLSEAMYYSVMAGGKRLRPVMLLSACEMSGGDSQAALPIACALEMIHTYSLIHDDLPAMDNDQFRRGLPTNHMVFGEAMAILAGDGLLSYAFQTMLSALIQYQPYIPGYARAVKEVADGAGVWGMVAGQVLDMQNEKNPKAGYNDLLEIHAKKTGAMIKASVLAGAYMGGNNHEELEHIRKFGEYFGLLFQITDDILDVVGSDKILGKTTGKDEKSEKLTYPKLFGLDESKERAARAAISAKAELGIFGEKAWFFNDLVDYTLDRDR